ncbi:hypothetical protein [Gloeomargarita lithophora]|uniref:hypothetical protein n=1 Tax=Gloeomargarita lithophora TaxID=1188228 RepID=UPI0012FE1F1F|nr:hypothetical protein [Gloeomargarita lithophora]
MYIEDTESKKTRKNVWLKVMDKLFFIQQVSQSPKDGVIHSDAKDWLFDNPKILGLVCAGLEQAKYGVFSSSFPDVQADLSWLSDIEDEVE